VSGPSESSLPPILRVGELSKRFGGFVALDGVDVEIRRGERIGLIGPNGSGKTTLINCISGALPIDGGTIHFDGRDISRLKAHERTRLGIARSFQIPRPFRSMTVYENLAITAEYATEPGRLSIEAQVHNVLRSMGLMPRAEALSGGLTQIELRKLELARAMAANPRLLISDEAMAGLSSNEVDELLEILFRLNEGGVTIIMIEHIMRAVMRFSERVIVLDAGQKIAEGTPDEVVSNPDVERAYLGA
jgi:branched-chain amino acid transport system ATP-binding protein